MSTPESNAQFVNSLFSPAAAQIQRMNSQRLALAETGLRRAWQLQDAQAAMEARKNLQADELAGRRDIQVLENKGRMDAAIEGSDRTINGAKEITDRQIEAERRKAYAAYVQLGGNEPLESFGTGEDALGKIQSASGKLQLKALKARIEVGGQFVKSRAANLRSLVNEKEIAQQASALAINDLRTQASGDVTKAISDITAGNEKVGLKKMSPEDQALYVSLKKRNEIALRVQQYKDPQVVDAIKGLRESQSSLMKLVQDAPAVGEEDVRSIFKLIPDVDEELGVKQAAPDFSKYFSGGSNTPASGTAKPVSSAAPTTPTGPMFKYPAVSMAGVGERAIDSLPNAGTDPLKILRMAALAGSGGNALFREPSDTELNILSYAPKHLVDRPLSALSRGLGTGDWSAQAGFGEVAGNRVADSIIAARDTYDATMPALRTAGSAAGRSIKDYLLRALINRNAAEEPTTP